MQRSAACRAQIVMVEGVKIVIKWISLEENPFWRKQGGFFAGAGKLR